MKCALIGGGILLVSSMLAAQTTSAPQDRTQSSGNVAVFLPAPACPVSMRALQGFGTGLIAVRDAKPADGPTQRVHLILSDASASRVVGAKIVVRGLSGKSQIVATLLASEERSDLTRTLDVRFAPEGDKDVATDLVLPGFTSVRSIQIDAINYKDGSSWAVAGRQACHVTPDPMMLVAGR